MSFFSKVSGTVLGQFGIVACNMAASMILSRQIHPDGVGQYELFRQFTFLVISLGALGVGISSIYYIRNHPSNVSLVLHAILVQSLGLAAILIPVFLGIRYFYPDYFGVVPPWLPPVFIFGTVTCLAGTLFQQVMIAQLAIRKKIISEIYRPLVVLVGICVIILFVKITPAMAIALFSLGNAAMLTMAAWSFRDELAKIRQFWVPWKTIRPMFVYGMKAYANQILALAGMSLTVILLRSLALDDFTQLGLYTRAASVATLAYMIPRMVGPLIYSKWAGREVDSTVRGEVERMTRFNLLYGTICTLTLCLFGRQILSLLYGPAFADADAPLRWLSLGVLCNSLFSSLMNLLVSQGRVAHLFPWYLFSTVVLIVVMYLGFDRWGIQAPAIAMSLSKCIVAGGGLLLCRRYGIRLRRCLGVHRSDLTYIRASLARRKAEPSIRPSDEIKR